MDNFLYYFYLTCFLLVGLSVGSFINVVIYRLPLKTLHQQADDDVGIISLSWPPSHCPQCNAMILNRDNVPLFSWIMLKGRCRFCQAPIPLIYPMTELIHGLWFFLGFIFLFTGNNLLSLLPVLVLFCTLYAITIIDIRHYIIPDPLNYFLLWSGMVFSVTGITAVSPLSAVMGVCVIWLVTHALMFAYERIRKVDGLGGGDVKLFAAVMPWVGIENIHVLLLLSSCTGLAIIVLYKYLIKIDFNHQKNIENTNCEYIPFGPAISFSVLYIFLRHCLG
ncbi:A24 family peptidase [Citrobacter meridianamericanus]|uniref:prepilin peptidase n=1 Tax=Citrobacter meridianamericanus TaxID=2894201 RepID=UPI00351D34B8